MRRLLTAALIALACHGLLFALAPLTITKPPRLKAARRPVNLNLAHFVPAAPTVREPPSRPAAPREVKPPPPPLPKPRPKPKTKSEKPPPKPQPKPLPRPTPPAPIEPPTARDTAPQQRAEAVSKAPPASKASPPAAAKVAAVADPGPVQAAPIVEATPLYADNPPPPYPRSARRRGHQGMVLLAVFVNSAGRVDTLKVKKSSGFKVLDEAALAAVRQWRFESGRRGDTPVGMWVEVPIRFELQ
jgi:periplasmic protein TonB